MQVQRIPRYILLLSDLLKNTPKGGLIHPLPDYVDHPDYQQTTIALQKTQEIAHYVNEEKRRAENISRVVTIQDSLIGLDEVSQLIHSALTSV